MDSSERSEDLNEGNKMKEADEIEANIPPLIRSEKVDLIFPNRKLKAETGCWLEES